MAMKPKMVALIMLPVIIGALLFGNVAYALTTHHVIHLTVTVVGTLSLNLENEWLHQNLLKPEAEAFSELKDDILVDKLRKGDSTVWRFTKTE